MVETDSQAADEVQKLGHYIIETLKNDAFISPYAILICAANTLPRAKTGALANDQIRLLFDRGAINPIHVVLNVKASFRNLPQLQFAKPEGDAKVAEATSPLSPNQFQIIDGNSTGSIGAGFGTIDRGTGQDLLAFDSITRLFLWRCRTLPDASIYVSVDHRGRTIKSKTNEKFSAAVANLVRRNESDRV